MSSAHDVPMRTCVACRTVAPQSTLLRFERRTDGDVVLAERAHRGRSAYVCPDRGCFERAVSRQAFARAHASAVRRPASWPEVLEPWRRELTHARALGRLGRRHLTLETVLARCEHGRTSTNENTTKAPSRATVAPTQRRAPGTPLMGGEGGV